MFFKLSVNFFRKNCSHMSFILRKELFFIESGGVLGFAKALVVFYLSTKVPFLFLNRNLRRLWSSQKDGLFNIVKMYKLLYVSV